MSTIEARALQTLEQARRQADQQAKEAILAASRLLDLVSTLDENIRQLTFHGTTRKPSAA